jgi:hypothetical protein
MSGPWAQAFSMVFEPYNIVVMLAGNDHEPLGLSKSLDLEVPSSSD